MRISAGRSRPSLPPSLPPSLALYILAAGDDQNCRRKEKRASGPSGTDDEDGSSREGGREGRREGGRKGGREGLVSDEGGRCWQLYVPS